MRRSFRNKRRLAALPAAAALAAAVVVLVGTGSASAGPAGVKASHTCLVMTGAGDPAFVKNFNPYTAGGGNLPSGAVIQGAFYEPLIVTGEGGLKPVPWLARTWAWSNGNKTLTLHLAKNVKWSDGTPLTSADVVYSLTAGKQDPIMDRIGFIGAGNNVASVKATDPYTVAITLKTPDSQFIAATLNRQFVVPQHIWSKVAKPATFLNSDPVGSGPFDTITRFTTQDYVLGKNPNYWQPGLPKVPCLEYVQAASNDAALALIQSGQVDWTHNFVPNVEKAYESKDPQHYHAFYATTAYPISLTFDDTAYPFNLVAFRKALSLAIDRNSVSKLGEYGYAPPTDAIGLSGLFPKWIVSGAVKAQAKAAAKYDPAAAKAMLTAAGFTYNGNQLVDPKGNPVSLDIHVISGWSDWVASNQIITKNLSDIGISLEGGSGARLGLLAAERDGDEEPDAALAERLAGLAVRLLLRQPRPERIHSRRQGRHADRQLGALRRSDRDEAPGRLEGHAESGEAAGARYAARGHLPQGPADHPALHRSPLVDLQHEVLPLLRHAEELLR